ncbi:MAG TPA: hypothetical protein VE959_25210 [Bryobacteraceae bacterium]|nr:hypothetical protein [Bryobacteraceae bacterium]
MNKTTEVLALTLLAIASCGPVSSVMYAQDGNGDAGRIVGSWRVTVTVTNPPGFPLSSFPVMMTFHSDGTALGSRLSYIPYGPGGAVLETTGHGAWQRSPGNQISAVLQQLLQGGPGNTVLLNGVFWATETVKFSPVVGPDGNSFTAPWTGTVVDTNGITVLQGGGTMSAVRVQVEP